MADEPTIGIVISTTRDARFGGKAADWVLDLAQEHGGAKYEIVDLRDYPLPFFDENTSPAFGTPENEVARRWGERIASLDGFIFVTAEYNHSFPAVLKNALDYAYPQFNRKPAAFVAYGGVGGARAVEHLRLVLVELQMAPLRSAVHIGMVEFKGMLMDGKTFDDFPYLAETAQPMLADLIWWTEALRPARVAWKRKRLPESGTSCARPSLRAQHQPSGRSWRSRRTGSRIMRSSAL